MHIRDPNQAFQVSPGSISCIRSALVKLSSIFVNQKLFHDLVALIVVWYAELLRFED